MTAPATGDTPLPPGSPPRHVDTSNESSVEPQGDRPLPGYVGLVENYDRPSPTAAEYRAAGYRVPDHDHGPVADHEVPGLVYADSPVAVAAAPVAQPEPEEPEPHAPDDSDAPPAEDEPEAEDEAEGEEEAPAEPPAAADPITEAGRAAARAREPRRAPYDGRTSEAKTWLAGYDEASQEATPEE